MEIKLLVPIAFKQTEFSSDDNVIVLAGDIGGTKANMSLCKFTANGMEVVKEKRYVSKDHVSFTDIISDFINGFPNPQ